MYPRCFGFKRVIWDKSYVHIVNGSVCDTEFVGPALKFSTLLEVIDPVTIYVHPSLYMTYHW